MFSLTTGIPKYYTNLHVKTDKFLKHSNKFLSRINADELTSKNNFNAVPEHATVREENFKCGKSLCQMCPHGPYYYAYWKDESGKLKKKYIGPKFDSSWKNKVSDKKRLKSQPIMRLLMKASAI